MRCALFAAAALLLAGCDSPEPATKTALEVSNQLERARTDGLAERVTDLEKRVQSLEHAERCAVIRPAHPLLTADSSAG
jgi:outer membrane murein-binding lipoprotein Lpp